jgi:hypothetical protein
MYPSGLEDMVKNNRRLWVVVEKIFNWLNFFAQRRGLVLNYSVTEIHPTPQDSIKWKSSSNSAILIQGPILYHKFLDNVINFYSANYPKVPIILSTWKKDGNIEKLRNLKKVLLIENESPAIPGIANINLQVVSTLSGLKLANERNASYVLKIRSDQGLFASNFLEQFMFSLVNAPTSRFKRIATTDFNSFLFRPNSPSDQIQFAETGTLLDYWSAYSSENPIDGSFPEEILLLAYLSKLGIPNSRSLKFSLETYRDCFVFLDSTDLGLVWRKGSWRHPDSRFNQLNRSSLLRFVSPDEWRRLQIDLESVLEEAKALGISNL